MTKPLRILLAALTLVALLAAGAATWVLLLLDPNDFKPRIAEFARRQGVALDIRGELTWQLLPRIGVRIGRTGLRADDGRVPELDFEALTLSMAWLPLLRGELRLDALELQGADIRIRGTEQAAMAAAAPLAAAPGATPAATADGLVVAVRTVTIRDSRVTVEGSSGRRALENLRLTGRDLMLDGTPFPVELEFDYRDPAMPLPIAVAFAAELGVDQQKLLIETHDAKLTLTPEQRPAIEASFGLHLDGSRETLDITDLELDSAGLIALGELQVSNLGGEPQAEGRLELPLADPRPLLHAWQVPLPAFDAPNALGRLGLRTGFRVSPQKLYLSDFELEVDDTRVAGTLDLAMTGSARDADPDRLQQSPDAQGSFRITDPILARTNIERTFCDLVATVERTPKRDDWPDLSRFETITGSFRLAGPRVTLDDLTTGIGNLRLRASGTFDRASQRYEVLAIMRLDGDRTSASGCPVRSESLRNRDIPLRCSGSLGAQSRMPCAPDPQFVAGLIGDRAVEELRERGKLEGERGKAVEGLLKGLLKRNRDGD